MSAKPKTKQAKAPGSEVFKWSFITIALLWFGAGTAISWSQWQQVSSLSQVNRIPHDQRSMALYGTDLLAYQELQKTPEHARILFLVPDSYYVFKSVYFLYPRTVTPISLPQNINQYDLKQYDYLLLYYSIPEFSGFMRGLVGIQRAWQLEDLLALHNTLSKQAPINLEQYKQILIRNGGCIIYPLAQGV